MARLVGLCRYNIPPIQFRNRCTFRVMAETANGDAKSGSSNWSGKCTKQSRSLRRERRGGKISRWCVYLIISADMRKTYVGITTHFKRRLKQHNGMLNGGAKASRAGRPWQCACLVEGFKNRSEASRFEWNWKSFSRISSRKPKKEENTKKQHAGYTHSCLVQHRQAALEKVKNFLDCRHLTINWQEQQA